MDKNKTNIIYLMGAGRSGTTILASLLGASKDILTIGEMHQFLEHIVYDKNCSCGESLKKCQFWTAIVADYYKKNISELRKMDDYMVGVESHSKIPISFFKRNEEHIKFQENFYSIITKLNPSKYYLDSAKFISRVLQLRKSDKLNVKIIYLVRDVRGVINSFAKNVQTQKNPISTIIYYTMINTAAQIVEWTYPKEILKLRYEDFIEKPVDTLDKIEQFIEVDLTDVKEVITEEKYIDMPHIIGGNRLKSQSKIKLRKDLTWKRNIKRVKQILYYFLTLPLMLLNKYKL
ncbi:MAG TPA: sulfotransferase [Bacteroidia bacterium]|nr:sulfotransferase [Bacteroidia bacterium]